MKFSMRRLLAAVFALALLASACGNDDTEPDEAAVEGAAEDAGDGGHGHDAGGEDEAEEVSEPALRLLVADSASGSVLVLDLATGDEIATLDLHGPARLYTEPHGRHVLAAQRDDDRIDWIDSGAWTVDHGDHAHHWARDPGVTAWGEAAAAPTHVVFHDDLLTLFNDGDGSWLVADTHHLGESDARIATGATGDAHHGVAVAMEDLGVVVATELADHDGEPDPGTLPSSVVIVDLETGDEIGRFDGECPSLHGEYATDEVVAFGCADGVLLLEPHGDHWHSHKVAPPEGSPEGARTGTLRGGHGLDYLIGNLGREALVRVDLSTETVTLIPLPASAAAWTFDATNEQILVLDVNGSFHSLDPVDGEVVASIEVTEQIEMPESPSDPWPAVIVAGNRAYATDPERSTIIELAVDGELRESRRFDLGFAPFSLTVAGLGSN